VGPDRSERVFLESEPRPGCSLEIELPYHPIHGLGGHEEPCATRRQPRWPSEVLAKPLLVATEKATREDRAALVELLLEAGADPNLGDDEGTTALRTVVDGWSRSWIPAVKDRVFRIATALLAAGAVDRPGPDGKTSLDVALERDAGRIANALRAAR